MPATLFRIRVVAALAWAVVIAAAPDVCAQPPTGEAGTPAMRAAGMALRDGALAPGMLTVRVVRGSFDRNAANETVQVDVGGRIERATTGTDGRAQFAHLPIGAMVQATAVVDGESLVSERFEMAAESGIRVLLIAGEGNASASGVPHPAGADPVPGVDSIPGGVAVAPPAPFNRDAPAVAGIRVAFALATAAALAFVVFGTFGWRPWRSHRPAAETLRDRAADR